jgi:hypothetical protein
MTVPFRPVSSVSAPSQSGLKVQQQIRQID